MAMDSVVRRRKLVVLGALVATWVATQAPLATAKVYVDPDGPAGQEYALPLDSARGSAAGTTDAGVPGGSTQAPLFGQGIRPSGGSESGPGGRHQDLQAAEGGGGTVAARRAAAIASEGGGSTIGPIAAMIGGVVLLGTAAGLLVRRRFPPAAPD